MRTIFLSLAVSAAVLAPAYAGGTHAGGHHNEMAIGAPGEKTKAKRAITIVMKDRADGRMVFEPSTLMVRKGETVRLRFLNKGTSDHEYVMDLQDAVLEHKEVMAKFPEMEHDDPNAIRLAPGASGEIVWTFSNSGEFTFACLIPGHYEAGMKGAIKVAAK